MQKLIRLSLSFGLILSLTLFAGPSPEKPVPQPTIPPGETGPFVDQIDETDIYAIPFDTSESEENVEEEQLEELQKEYFPKKLTMMATVC